MGGWPRLVEETLEEASCDTELRLYEHQLRAQSWLALPHAMLVCPFADVPPHPHVPCPAKVPEAWPAQGSTNPLVLPFLRLVSADALIGVSA